MSTLTCHLCLTGTLADIPAYARMTRIASDSTVWKKGGCLCVCQGCGGVQKKITSEWEAEIAEIYRRYSIYHVSEGQEQQVFAAGAGAGLARSVKLVQFLKEHVSLPKKASHLDVGCGNGAFLKGMSSVFPDWDLFGSEVSNKYQAEVEAIPGVKGFFSQDLSSIPGTYDVISLVHVLEHIAFPTRFLESIRKKLAPTGTLFIELPYYADNPFDLLIADHSTHFTTCSLEAVVRRAGFDVVAQSKSWVHKELTLVATPGTGTKPPQDDPARTEQFVERSLAWLEQVLVVARSLPNPLGIFGTSNAAAWIHGELGERVGFYIDEDEAKIGKSVHGKPIYSPMSAPSGASVLLPLPYPISLDVRRRLTESGVRCKMVLPPIF